MQGPKALLVGGKGLGGFPTSNDGKSLLASKSSSELLEEQQYYRD
jgi:hypothetical protein